MSREQTANVRERGAVCIKRRAEDPLVGRKEGSDEGKEIALMRSCGKKKDRRIPREAEDTPPDRENRYVMNCFDGETKEHQERKGSAGYHEIVREDFRSCQREIKREPFKKQGFREKSAPLGKGERHPLLLRVLSQSKRRGYPFRWDQLRKKTIRSSGKDERDL